MDGKDKVIEAQRGILKELVAWETAVGNLGVVGVLMRSRVDSGDAPANAALEPIWAAMRTASSVLVAAPFSGCGMPSSASSLPISLA